MSNLPPDDLAYVASQHHELRLTGRLEMTARSLPDDGFPILYEVSTDRSYPLGGRAAATFGGVGRADIAVDDWPSDQLLFRVGCEDGRWFLEPLNAQVTVSVNQAPAKIRVSLTHLAIVQVDRRLFLFVLHDDPAVSNSYAARLWLIGKLRDKPKREAPNLRATVEATLRDIREVAATVVPLELPGAIQLPERQLVIGRDPEQAEICLPDLRVSRVHAWIVRDGRTATITDLRSTNGTFVDGRRIQQPTLVREGGRIQIGSYNLILRADALHPLSHDRNVELVAHRLVRRVPDRHRQGQSKVILDDISLVIRPREFVCILGPSGSGKTTLLSALSARVPADEGSVLLNGESLFAHFEALKQNLAVVPQRDVLHDVLPLDAALWYTAKLRLPTDTSREDILGRISEILTAVNLTQQRLTPIRRLSGGEVRRASWANEAICNPSLIFLDEVTSGLDEQTDCEMMQLFRRMADEGKTIVCVTHSLSYVEQNCHLVVILAPGGVLAFVGRPADALQYFGISRLGDVYQRLSEASPGEWKDRFRNSPYYREYVQRRLPESLAEHDSTGGSRGLQLREIIAAWRQWLLLTRRYVSIEWANRKTLAMMAGQSLFIAFLLVWLFGNLTRLKVEDDARRLAEVAAPGIDWSELLAETQQDFVREAEEVKRADRSSKLLFLLCISCLWFGCNNAAKEIVKERTIYSKERDVGLKVISYYGSKLALLGLLSVLQATLLLAIVRGATQLGGSPSQQWLLLSLASLTGAALGLAISALAGTEDVAVTMVPIALIPQIILAGLIAPLVGFMRGFAQLLVSSYWSYQGLLVSLDEKLQDRLRSADCLSLDAYWTGSSIACVLTLHILVFAVVAIVALHMHDGRESRFLRSLRRK